MQIYQFKFVAVTADGDIYDPQAESVLITLDDLGKEGWHVVGMIPESSRHGFGHTLILQQDRVVLTVWMNGDAHETDNPA